MSLRRKPHTFTLITVTESHTGGRVDVPVEGASRAIRCQITPMNADAVLRTFAPQTDVSQPHLMLCDTGDAAGIKVGDRGIYDGERYFVNAPVMAWKAGVATNCAQILLEKEQFQQ